MSLSSLLSGLVVLTFIGIALNLTIEGKTKRNRLLKQSRSLSQQIQNHLSYSINKIPNHEYSKINSLAILEKVWNEMPESQAWEENKRYCQSLPNLLLSLGLLGTFLGISLNLFLLARNTAGDLQIKQALSDIIGSMGIAFGCSLFALLCSIFLIKFHPTFSLDIEKERIFSELENYLDNEYLPSLLAGKTLPEKIDYLILTIHNYSQNMHSLLIEFPQTIQDLHQAASAASQLINDSANTFQTKVTQSSSEIQVAANTLDTSSQKLIEMTKDFSQILGTLNRSITQLDTSSQSLTNSSSILHNYGSRLENINNTLNQKTLDVESLIKQYQKDSKTLLSLLTQSAESLNDSSENLNQNVTKLKISLNQETSEVKEYNQRIVHLTQQVRSLEKSFESELSQTLLALKENTSKLENQTLNLQEFTNKLDNLNPSLSTKPKLRGIES